MTTILSALLQGIFIAIGIVLGFIAMGITLFFLTKRLIESKEEDPEFSIELFEQYLQECLQKEAYQEANEVHKIILALQNGEEPEQLENYTVEEDNYLEMDSNEGKETFRLAANKKIVRK